GESENNNLYRNEVGSANSWINVNCVGVVSNNSAVGARLSVKATIDGAPVWQTHEISSQNGYCTQNSLNAEFGLGDAVLIDSLVIAWPSGIEDIYTDLDVNQFVNAIEGGDLCYAVDSDRDGYADPGQPADACGVDNCPDVFNPEQVDVDGDMIGDVCDLCPNDAENDIDSDGWCAEVDNCPSTPNPGQEDSNGDGIGDACCCIQRGDIDYDGGGQISIADLVYMVDFMFSGGDAPACMTQADVDADGGALVTISDLVYLVDYMFNGGPAPGACPA
ncbi:MAG: ASPIC/UnbV domain-containing protein, partial [candidate division Zixibacteria bacterium]|nr:ASPIC/UnbV domain-containing protein [candidate division Zixibacteria bacterium]